MTPNENFHHGQSRPSKDIHNIYQPLSVERHEIRIFLLQPSPIRESDIYGNLKVISLSKDKTGRSPLEPFEALSYTWGTEQSCDKLTIDGIAMSMKSNLETFLRHRRWPDRVVPLWIDALCINQEDDEEKNHQIPIMNVIYAAAKDVTIWLGAADADSDLAMRCLNHLGNGSPYEKLPALSRHGLEAVQRFLSRPWWSRVWIIQEVVMGGLGDKLSHVIAMCGEEDIAWSTLVIAAARFWAYRAERRQYFPNLPAILDLDRIRHDCSAPLSSVVQSSIGPRMTGPSTSQWAIGLVSEYRHFQATDPRDKVYALANMFAINGQNNITPDYTAAPSSVYTDFAIWALEHCSGLELLRHCGTRALDIPSWVPDWSVSQNCLLLPSKNRSALKGAPWWSQPSVKRDAEPTDNFEDSIQYFQDPQLTDKQRKAARRRLKIAAKGCGKIMSFDEIPRNFACYKRMESLPKELKEWMTMGMRSGKVIGAVLNNDSYAVHNSSSRIDTEPPFLSERDTAKSQGLFIEKQMNLQLARDLQDLPYQAAGATSPKFDINGQSLTVEGILWDEIESVHCEFVSNVDTNFEDTTRFMVAIGQCKAMAEDSIHATRRLPDLEERLKSFWLCVLAGHTGTSDLGPSSSADSETSSTNGDPLIEYMNWLPLIPSTWNPRTPTVTVTTTGYVEIAERIQRLETILALDRVAETAPKGKNQEVINRYPIAGIIHKEWTADEYEMYQQKFKELGLLWSEQRFDLYHMPFEFLNVVPDPYWDTRKDHDELARWKTHEYFFDPDHAIPCDITEKDVGSAVWNQLQHRNRVIYEEKERLWATTTSRTPKGTLPGGFEKYALGRKFFITKKGYFGLTSKEAKVGDRVAVLLGSDVPFVLRACGRVEGKRNWQMIGEAYVDGIMDGEVLNQVDLGNVQPSMIHIS